MTMKSIIAASALAASALAFVGFGASAHAAGSSLPNIGPLLSKSSIEQARYRGDSRRGDNHRGGHHFARGRCVAVGVTINGRSIPGVRGVGFGRNACREALNECRVDLRHRKHSGRNPFGRCVVTGWAAQ